MRPIRAGDWYGRRRLPARPGDPPGSPGGDCTGWGYDDLHDGTEVTLTDENGKLLAVGMLTRASTCSFGFSLDNVPPGRQFYGITVTHRGTLHYSEQQLRQGVELTIG